MAGRRMGSGALLTDPKGRILLVKPSYKPLWEIPGGAIDPGESPRACCQRELLEELGMEIPVGRLLVMDWLPPDPPQPDGWMFVYDGGILNESDTATIVLPEDELVEWTFVDDGDLDDYLAPHMVRRLRIAHECAAHGTTVDLEFGFRPSQQFGAVREGRDST